MTVSPDVIPTDVATKVLRVLGADGPLTGAVLRRKVRFKDRAEFDRAIAELLSGSLIASEPTTGNRGVRYSIAATPPASQPTRRRRNADLVCLRCKANKRRVTGPYCGRCLSELARAGARRPGAGRLPDAPNPVRR
jgi:hypothetical protein